MDIPRYVLRTLFRDTSFPLIQHHVDSFNALLDTGIPQFIKASNPHELGLTDGRKIRVWVGGRDGNSVRYESPVDEVGNAVVPHACRLDNKTYALSIFVDMEVEYLFDDNSSQVKSFPNVLLGKIPLMLRSKYCYLTGMDAYEIGECHYELGGYFVIDGAEKVLLTQERLGNNMFYAGDRARQPTEQGAKTLVEWENAVKMENAKFESDREFYAGIRSVSEDASRGPYSHFLVLPAQNRYNPEEKTGSMYGRDRRLVMITAPGFNKPIPALSLFRALGITTDEELYNITLAGVNDKDRIAYSDIFAQIIFSHEKYLKEAETTDLDTVRKQTRTRSMQEVVANLHTMLFPHCEGDADKGGMYRRKAYMLGHMLRMAMDVALEIKKPSDRDHMAYKRLDTSGDLCFLEFRRIFRDGSKAMLLDLDKRMQYERKTYEGKNIVNLVQPENIGYFWKGYRLLNEFSKSFKGAWGGKDGIAQELSRVSYLGVISHLRRTNLQMDRTASTAPPRRLHGSQFGIMCPNDSPDGRNVGYIKSLAVLAQVSTAFPSLIIRQMIAASGLFRSAADIDPLTWDPRWTKIYVNNDLIGISFGDTEKLHATLVTARRTGEISQSVSLGWDRVANEYRIFCDSGRPVRPIYRESTIPEDIRRAKGWKDIARHLDYVDAAESDVSRFSLVPFDPKLQSEIHMSFNLSAMTNLVPFSDHNPAPRITFSIAQSKQACAWYHTNYTKRFDTIAVMLNQPQKPLCQTWMYRETMGPGGCMPYGENAIVAVTMYGGYNQEDSVMMNKTSLNRGMFRTSYFHSYDIAESMLDPALQTHTQVVNVLMDPKYRDSVKRQDGKDYEKLDANGFIKPGSEIDETTILVGMVTPVMNAAGQITGWRDVSQAAKRGQRGRIDAVYQYSIVEPVFGQDKIPVTLKGVKIRLAEERSPVLGDKMGTRHSQKGTIGMLLDESDMPFTAGGLRPDLIFNPHGLPTRMTVGHLLESAYGKLACDLGTFVDATPFTVSKRTEDVREMLAARGFQSTGHEVLYNGMTGEMMEADIFMGPMYYQRLKHMVEDKINYRDTGPKTLLTHQPLEGRANEGGLRIGEMERDALVSHGMAKFLNESLMERSDKTEVLFNKEQGRLEAGDTILSMPYSMSLFTRELEALHVNMKLIAE